MTKKRNFGSLANFRIRWEFALAPKELVMQDIVLRTDNSFFYHMFKIVHITAIKHKILDECAVSPFHDVFTHKISNSFGKEIMNVTNMAGSSYSYNTDLTHSRGKHDEQGCSKKLQQLGNHKLQADSWRKELPRILKIKDLGLAKNAFLEFQGLYKVVKH